MPFQPQSLTLDTAKRMAQRLRKSLAQQGTPVPQHQALDLVAQTLGFEHWHQAKNRLAASASEPAPAPALDEGAMTTGPYGDPVVPVPDVITLADLAMALNLKASVIIKDLHLHGVMATMNQPLDQITAAFVVKNQGRTPVDATTGYPIQEGEPAHAIYRPAFEQVFRQALAKASKPRSLAFSADRACYEDPIVQLAFASFVAGRQPLMDLTPEWDALQRAFRGAFDTPVERRRRPDAYAEDVRERMVNFSERWSALRLHPEAKFLR